MNIDIQWNGAETLVRVTAREDGVFEPVRLEGRGSARCRPDDAYSKTVGAVIAAGRAFINYGSQLEEYGNSKTITKADLDRVIEHMERVIVEAEGELGSGLIAE